MSYTKHILRKKKKKKKPIVPTLKRVHILYELPATMNFDKTCCDELWDVFPARQSIARTKVRLCLVSPGKVLVGPSPKLQLE